MVLKWGIVSAGKISADFVMALQTLPKTQHEIVAVATREDVTRAKEFAYKFEIKEHYGNYNELSTNPDVDIVYIGAIHPCHYDIAMLMMNNNKHVLCEKPLTMNLKQTAKLINYAEKKKLLLVEGIWSRFFPLYDEITINLGSLGQVHHITVSFGENLYNVNRLMKKELGGGTILDLGVYCLQFVLFVYSDEEPLNVEAYGDLNDDGVDTFVSATLTFSGKRTATFVTSSLVNLPNEAVIYGTNGVMRIPDFWCPTELTFKTLDENKETFKKTISRPLPKFEKEMNFINSVGLTYEIKDIFEYLQSDNNLIVGNEGLKKIPYKTSIILAKLMDKIREQVKVVYPSDKNL